MKYRIVAKVLALLSVIISISMLWPLWWSWIDGSSDFLPFVKSIGIGLGISVLLFLPGHRTPVVNLGIREAFAVVTFSWILASVIGGLPYLFNGTVSSFTDAFFEAMSGFTTTGASILTDIESNPRGILFWRDFTHWLGGMGIIVLSLAILPFLGVGGMQLYKAEVPGPVPEKLTPRVQQTALLLWGVYVLLSCLEVIALFLGGMTFYECLTHTFGTMATGGFSPLNGSIGQYNNVYFDWVITIFMFLAGANFALHYFMLRGKFSTWWKDEEFRFYTWVVVFAVVTVTISLVTCGLYTDLADALRYSAFQVVSIVTTTGYVTADYELWPFYTQFLLLGLMFVGGCAGSTGGGMKNLRIMILSRHVKAELKRLLHPKSMIQIRMGGNPVNRDIIGSVTAFFILYIAIFAVGALIMAGLGLDVLSAVASVAATLGNIGPGLGMVGPVDNYSLIPTAGKWVLCLFMLLGRLEIYTVVMLLLPGTWES